MIILGNKYNFTEAELQEIKLRFSDIVNISYKDKTIHNLAIHPKKSR